MEPGRAAPRRSRDPLGKGGTSRPRARLCRPLHPTVPRGRKAEPRLPGPRSPLPAAAAFGWWWPSVCAGDGRGCRYGDRSVALGAARLRTQNCPSPYRYLLPPPRGRRAGFTSRQVRVKTRGREGLRRVWKGEGSFGPFRGLIRVQAIGPSWLGKHRPRGLPGASETESSNRSSRLFIYLFVCASRELGISWKCRRHSWSFFRH